MEKIETRCSNVLSQYPLSPGLTVEPFGNGLINRTWLVNDADKDYILQKINSNVFRQPEHIAYNIELIDDHLKKYHPEYFFVAPIKSNGGANMVLYEGDYYRLFAFVKGSITHQVVQTPAQAYEAARQFGLFTHNLSGLPAEKLKITIPSFHDLVHRYRQFEEACKHGSVGRIQQTKDEIGFIIENASIVKRFKAISSSRHFRTRVTHHDTKISNVLFDQHEKGICVIDLDTVMPGFFISDVGDMLRTYLSPVSEEESDLSRIEIRNEYFAAILEGYLSCMKDDLTKDETEHFVYAGMFMIYMQAIRFLADYLNNDKYYGASYEGHNLVRAQNQIRLLKCLQEKETVLNQQVLKFIK